MRVDDVMTRTVVTVRPTATIEEAANLMTEHRVSGLPVVDEAGTLLGIVSDGDLILRQRPAERVTWWRMFFDDGEALAGDYRKRIGTMVVDVMTHPVISVRPEVDVSVAATLLHTRNIRRLPVVAAGTLVGIVSRGDLVKLFGTPRPPTPSRTGKALGDELQRRLNEQPWIADDGLAIFADGGVVELWGTVDSESARAAIEATARSIEGCREVRSNLVVTAVLSHRYGV
jgi:CBS domain-containing protein